MRSLSVEKKTNPVMMRLNISRKLILHMHMQKLWYHSELFGPLTPYNLIRFECADIKLNTWGPGKMVKIIQSECMNQPQIKNSSGLIKIERDLSPPTE